MRLRRYEYGGKMKNKKWLKLLASLALGGVMAVSVFGMAACGGGGGDDDNKKNEQNDTTVSSVTVTAAGGANSVEIGKTLQLTASVAGSDGVAQTVTWKSSDENKATVSSSGLVTGAGAGSVTITATSTVDKTKYGEITLTVKEASSEVDNAIVPEYKGPANGPEAGAKSITYKLNGADIPVGTLSEEWTNGIFTIASGAELRNRVPTGEGASGYTRSIKNGTITVNVPSSGKLKFAFSSGSSNGGAKYQITGQPEVEITTGDKVLNIVEIDVQQGVYQFKKTNGTVDVYEVVLTLDGVEATPIESVEIVSAGTSDYLVTQKVDCTGVQLVAKDGSGVTHDVSLENCKFDTSKYNPNVSGEYEIGVTYYLASNLSSDKTEFTTSYKVKVYAVDSIVLDLIGLSGNTQLTAQQAYLTTDNYVKESNISVIATCEYNGSTIEYKLKKDWYSLTDSIDLSVAGTKTVTVSVDNTYTIGNKTVSSSYEIISAVKKDVVDNKVTVTVGKTGEFKTVTQAVQYLKKCNYKDSVNKVIEVEADTYTEKVWIDVPNVTLIGKGETRDDTVISFSLVEGDVDNYSGALWALNCATVHVKADNFKAYNISIRNDFDYIKNSGNYSGSQAAQGVALTLEGDNAVLYDCHLYGNQDTLYFKKGRSYYYKTQIDGNIDFIFGAETGLAYFEECDIVAINRTATAKGTDENGFVTAAQHKEGTKPDYGYIFDKCNLTDDGKVKDGSMSLGRPWGASATVAYIECSFSKAYSTKGYGDTSVKRHRWESMSGAEPTGADFCEYGSKGDGAIETAVTGGKVLSETQAANYTKANIFGTSNGKQSYSTVFDCDGALATLKILAGLEEGEIPEDKTVTINLNDSAIPNGNCVDYINTQYGEYLTWTGAGSFESAKPENGVKIAAGTVITLKVAGEVSLLNGYGSIPESDYVITYKDGCATITFVAATHTNGTFVGGIKINPDNIMPDTEYVQVTFDYNDENATADLEVDVIKGGKVTKPADPVRGGYTFEYWYTGDDDSIPFDFDTIINGPITLKAKWTAGQNATEYVAGDLIDITKITQTYQAGTDTVSGLEQGVLLDATSGKIYPNGDNTCIYDGAIIKVKVAEGLTVLPVWHKATSKDGFTVSVRDGEGYVTITAASGVQAYVMSIMVISAYSVDNGGTLTCGQGGMTASFQSGHYASNGIIEIDTAASGSKFDGKPNNNYAQVNGGTVIKLKVPEGVTDTSKVTVTITAYNSTDITDRYTLGYEDGYITLTAISNDQPGCYPSTFVITVNA